MNYLDHKNPIEVTQVLVKCPSITPKDAGALDVLQNILEKIGFTCTRLPFSEENTADVDNLYAEWGKGDKNLCFAGHTDVVPTGDLELWEHDPFAGIIDDIYIYGRGTSDMKGGIASFVSASANFIEKANVSKARISFLITGDEEGPAINGTKKMLEWLEENNKIPNHCLVGEPTNPHKFGEMMKVGRRGSLNGKITVTGTQGHVAYPHLANNPMPIMLKLLNALESLELDKGSEFFQPSNLEIVTIDVGNTVNNVIPQIATAKFNIRFNDKHSGASLSELIKKSLKDTNQANYKLDLLISGESFKTDAEPLTSIISTAVKKITGKTPEQSTTGGTSDARFIAQYCPVVEFGLVNETIHKINECSKIEDLEKLCETYEDVLEQYFMT